MGNKNDAPDKKVVSSEDARKFAETMHIEFYEASAKDNINVEDVRLCTHATPVAHVRVGGASRYDVILPALLDIQCHNEASLEVKERHNQG